MKPGHARNEPGETGLKYIARQVKYHPDRPCSDRIEEGMNP
jgi:hypothetical protein